MTPDQLDAIRERQEQERLARRPPLPREPLSRGERLVLLAILTANMCFWIAIGLWIFLR